MLKKILNSNLLKSSLIYSFFGLLSTAVPFLLLPMLTSYLSPEEYLYVDLFTNFFQILAAVIGINVFVSVSRFYIDKNKIDFSLYLSSIIIFTIISGVLFLVFTPIIIVSTNKFLNLNIDSLFVVSLIIYTLLHQLSEIKFSILLMDEKPFIFGLLKTLKTILDIGLSIFLIIYLHMKWEGRIIGQFVGMFFIAIYMIYRLKKEFNLTFKISYDYLKQAIIYSFPISLHLIAAFILGYIDRVFIIKMVGTSEAGLYSVAYQVGLGIALVQSSFNKAWVPYAFKELEFNEDLLSKIKLVKITYFYILFLLLIVFIFYFLIDTVFYFLIDEAFSEAKQYVIWIALGYAFNGMYNMVNIYFFYLKKTKILAMLSISVGVSNMILNYFLIDYFGTVGAAYATCLSFLLQFIIIGYFSNKYYPMPWFKFLNKSQ